MNNSWCTCGNMGRCLGCQIDKVVLEHLGRQGLAFLKEHSERGEKGGYMDGDTTVSQPELQSRAKV